MNSLSYFSLTFRVVRTHQEQLLPQDEDMKNARGREVGLARSRCFCIDHGLFLKDKYRNAMFNLEKLNCAEFSLFSVETLLQSGRERRQV